MARYGVPTLVLACLLAACSGEDTSNGKGAADVLDGGAVPDVVDVRQDKAVDAWWDTMIHICPEEQPDPDSPCEDGLECGYREICCCGTCVDNVVYDCKEGHFHVYSDDTCLVPWCALPPCCGEDDLCADWYPGDSPGDVCIKTEELKYGKCVVSQAPPFCWVDSDCPDGEICEGAVICPCNVDCEEPDQPGTCTSVGTP